MILRIVSLLEPLRRLVGIAFKARYPRCKLYTIAICPSKSVIHPAAACKSVGVCRRSAASCAPHAQGMAAGRCRRVATMAITHATNRAWTMRTKGA